MAPWSSCRPPEHGTYEPFVQRICRVTPALRSILGGLPKLPGGLFDARAPLEAIGFEFYEGTSADYNPQNDLLVLVNTQDQADFVDSFQDRDLAYFVPTKMEAAKTWLRSLFHRDQPLRPTYPKLPAIPDMEILPAREAP